MKSLTPTLTAVLILFASLTFAGGSPPPLPLSKAAALAEEELKSRALSDTHFIKSIRLDASGTIYTANIEPPVPNAPSDPGGKTLVLVVNMDGTVESYGVWMNRRRVSPDASQK